MLYSVFSSVWCCGAFVPLTSAHSSSTKAVKCPKINVSKEFVIMLRHAQNFTEHQCDKEHTVQVRFDNTALVLAHSKSKKHLKIQDCYLNKITEKNPRTIMRLKCKYSEVCFTSSCLSN